MALRTGDFKRDRAPWPGNAGGGFAVRLLMFRFRSSPQPRRRPWCRFVAAALGGLTAGAGAAHLLYTQGHKVGVELRPKRPEPLPPKPPTPEDYNATEPDRGRMTRRPRQIPHKDRSEIQVLFILVFKSLDEVCWQCGAAAWHCL